jgi:hypothetical protein
VSNVAIVHGNDLGAARASDRVSSNRCGHLHIRRRSRWREDGRLILEPLRHVSRVTNFTAVFFRRTTPQITNPGALWDESLNFYPRVGGTPHLGVREWRWPRAGKIKFSHLQFETTVYD